MRYYSSVAQAATLSGGINAVTTSITVSGVSGFPVSFPYTIAVDADAGSMELMSVTAAAGTTLTVVRGVDGTSAVTHSAGATVAHSHSAQDFAEPQAHIAATSNVHGTTSPLVGTQDVQTLTNKNLSAGTNTFPASLATTASVSLAVSNHASTTSGVHGVGAGSVVSTTSAQTLTNKTLTGVSLNNATLDGNNISLGWIGYNPTWSTTGTAPFLGNGTLAGAYMVIGKTVHVRIRLIAGSTTTFGTTGFSFTLPTAPASGYTTDSLIGHAICIDSSPIARYGGRSVFLGSGSAVFVVGPSNDYVQNTQPFTWAAGDSLAIYATYEAA